MISAILAVLSVNAAPDTTIAYGQITTVSEEPTIVIQGRTATEAAVRSYFEDIPIMAEIARCESTFRHTLADGSVLRGRVDNDDTGVMQINLRYHGARAERLELDLENIYDNMAFARLLYEEQGVQPWSASAPCWSRSLAMNS